MKAKEVFPSFPSQDEGNEGNAPPLPIKNGEQVNQQEQNSDNK